MLSKVADSTHEIIKISNLLNLQDEVAVINQQSQNPVEDIAIEVHMNSNSGTPGSGIETFWGAKELANTLNSILVKETGLKDRGAKEGNHLYFNNATSPRSALLEMGFINNPKDLAVVREKGATAVAKAIASAVGLADPSGSTPVTPTRSPKVSIYDFIENLILFLRKMQGE